MSHLSFQIKFAVKKNRGYFSDRLFAPAIKKNSVSPPQFHT